MNSAPGEDIWHYAAKFAVWALGDIASPLLGTLPGHITYTYVSGDLNNYSIMLTRTKTKKQPKCPWTGEWTNKMKYFSDNNKNM